MSVIQTRSIWTKPSGAITESQLCWLSYWLEFQPSQSCSDHLHFNCHSTCCIWICTSLICDDLATQSNWSPFLFLTWWHQSVSAVTLFSSVMSSISSFNFNSAVIYLCITSYILCQGLCTLMLFSLSPHKHNISLYRLHNSISLSSPCIKFLPWVLQFVMFLYRGCVMSFMTLSRP